MIDLRLILELVVDGLDDEAFTQQELVAHQHQAVFHIGVDAGDDLETVFQQRLKERLREIALIAKQLAKQGFRQFGDRFMVIDIPPASDLSRKALLTRQFFQAYPLRATNNDRVFRYNDTSSYKLFTSPYFPRESQTAFGLTNDSMHIHTLRLERANGQTTGQIVGITWTTYIFQFGAEVPKDQNQTEDLNTFPPNDGIRSSTFPANPALWTGDVRYVDSKETVQIMPRLNMFFELIIPSNTVCEIGG